MTSTGRNLSAAVATALTSVALLVTILAHYASVVSSPSFSRQAVSVIETGAVRSLVVDTVSGRILAAAGNQTSLEPIIRQGVQEALSNPQVTADIRAAADSLQSQLVSGHATNLTLSLPNVAATVAAAVQSRSPQLAAAVARVGTVTVVDVRIPPSASQAVNDLAQLGRDASLLVVLTIALAALALLLSTDRRRTLVGLGLAALVSGLLAAAAYLGGRELVVSQFSSAAAQTAAGAVWRVFVGGLETLGLVIAGAGAAVAGAGVLLGAARSPRATASSW